MTIWTDRFGEQIDIENSMTDGHLQNVVAAVCEGRVRASEAQAAAMVRELDVRGMMPVAYNQSIYVSNAEDEAMLFLRREIDRRLGRPSAEPIAYALAQGGPLRAPPVAFDPTRVLIAGAGTSWTGRPESEYVLVEETTKKPEPRRPLKHDEKPFTYKRKIDV